MFYKYKVLNHLIIHLKCVKLMIISCFEHKSLLLKVLCKETLVHHTDYRGCPMCSITTIIWNKIHVFWAGVYKQGSIIHHLHCQIYLISQIVKVKIH